MNSNNKIIEQISAKGMLSYTMSLSSIWLIILLSILQHAITVMTPFFIIFVISKLWFIDNSITYIEFAIGFVILGALWVVLAQAREQLFYSVFLKYNKNISNESLELLLNLPYSYIGNLPIESQFSRYLPLDNLGYIWLNNILKPMLDLPLVILAFAVICKLLGFTYFITVASILIAFTALAIYKSNIKKSSSNSITDAELQGTVTDTLNNLDIIKSHHRENFFYKYNQKIITNKYIEKYLQNTKSELISNINEVLLLLIYIASLIFAVYYTLSDVINIKYLIVILLLTWFSISPLKNILGIIDEIPKAKNILNQLRQLQSINTSKHRHKKSDLSQLYKGSVSASNVYLKYPGSNSFSLNNISFKLDKNKILLINGPSGSGKSSLLSIIAGILEPSSGKVFLDNDYDIESISSKSLNNTIILISSNSINNTDNIISNLDSQPTSLSQLDYFDTKLKNKLILIDEPLINSTEENYKELLNKINTLKNNNTIIIASMFGFYSKIADEVLLLKDGGLSQYLKKNPEQSDQNINNNG